MNLYGSPCHCPALSVSTSVCVRELKYASIAENVPIAHYHVMGVFVRSIQLAAGVEHHISGGKGQQRKDSWEGPEAWLPGLAACMLRFRSTKLQSNHCTQMRLGLLRDQPKNDAQNSWVHMFDRQQFAKSTTLTDGQSQVAGEFIVTLRAGARRHPSPDTHVTGSFLPSLTLHRSLAHSL